MEVVSSSLVTPTVNPEVTLRVLFFAYLAAGLPMTLFYLLLKTLHILGFAVAYGINICTFIAYRHFWGLFRHDRAKGLAAFRSFRPIFSVGMYGLIVVLVAGILMLIYFRESLLDETWFRWKLGLVGLIFVNGFTFGRKATLALYGLLDGTINNTDDASVTRIRTNLSLFQVVQMFIYLDVVILSIFRP